MWYLTWFFLIAYSYFVSETTWKVKSQSKGKNKNIIDCFWLHVFITIVIIVIIIIVIIIIIIIITIIITVNPSTVLVNNIQSRSMYIKTSTQSSNFAQS